MRTFIAINLSSEARTHLMSIQSRIKASASRGSWSREQNLHMTLAFLGDISRLQADTLTKTLRARLADTESFELTLSHLGYFQDESCATLWCSTTPSNNLKALVTTVAKAVQDCRIDFDRKPFKAHVTLARRADLTNVKLNNVTVEKISSRISSIILYQSTLTPEGPIYRALEEIRLKDD